MQFRLAKCLLIGDELVIQSPNVCQAILGAHLVILQGRGVSFTTSDSLEIRITARKFHPGWERWGRYNQHVLKT